MASNLQYRSALMTVGHNGNPKVSTVFWRETSEFVEDEEAPGRLKIIRAERCRAATEDGTKAKPNARR
jgi:hypothetical protein